MKDAPDYEPPRSETERQLVEIWHESIGIERRAVAEAAVVGRPSAQLGEKVVAFAVCRGSVEPEALIDHCRKRLSAFKVPREIILVAELPRTTFGKVDRKRLRSVLIS